MEEKEPTTKGCLRSLMGGIAFLYLNHLFIQIYAWIVYSIQTGRSMLHTFPTELFISYSPYSPLIEWGTFNCIVAFVIWCVVVMILVKLKLDG